MKWKKKRSTRTSEAEVANRDQLNKDIKGVKLFLSGVVNFETIDKLCRFCVKVVLISLFYISACYYYICLKGTLKVEIYHEKLVPYSIYHQFHSAQGLA